MKIEPNNGIVLEPVGVNPLENWELEEFLKMYDQWKDDFHIPPIVESFLCGFEYEWILRRTVIDEEYDDEYIGFIILGPYRQVEFLWVNENERRKGIGTFAVETSGAKYYDYALNDSISFWESTGLSSCFRENEDGNNVLIDELENTRQDFLHSMSSFRNLPR
tara:strand:- start:61 stop:549 length:489 start_codon:yes stop_codon:yes gene_type:complete